MHIPSIIIHMGEEEKGPTLRMVEDDGCILGDRHVAIFCKGCGNIWYRHIKLVPSHLRFSGHSWSLYHADCPACCEASGAYYTHLFQDATPRPLVREDILRVCKEIEA